MKKIAYALMVLFISTHAFSFTRLTPSDIQFIQTSLKDKAALSYMNEALAVSPSLISTCTLKNINRYPGGLPVGKFVAFMACQNKENSESTLLVSGADGPYKLEDGTTWNKTGIMLMLVQRIYGRPDCINYFSAFTDTKGVVDSKTVQKGDSGTCRGYRTAAGNLIVE